jgi:hypothetical protein
MDHQNSGVPEFSHFRRAQIGNIRFAVVKPAGDAPGRGKHWVNSTERRISVPLIPKFASEAPQEFANFGIGTPG